MSGRRSKVVDAVIHELAVQGIAGEVVTGKKHSKVRFWIGGRKHTITCSISASDHRAILNARGNVRKLIKEVRQEL